MGYLATGWNIGIKDDSLDFAVLHSTVPACAAALFTRNNFPGNPVIVGKEHIAGGRLQTIIVNSKNANVATGPNGLALARGACVWTARGLGIAPELVLPSSTGVIGRPMPESKIRDACEQIPSRLKSADFDTFSRAIMTTDKYPKMRTVELKSGIRFVAVAKGAGMIEPNMATMLAYTVTDARIATEDLNRMIRSIADRTYNRLSVDGDTSTSDTFVIMANGLSETEIRFSKQAAEKMDALVDPFADGALDTIPDLDAPSREFVSALLLASRDIVRLIAGDGEGATRLIELVVDQARDRDQALKIGRSIINSPLVKTAVYGGDPNWGRLVMAVGKVFDEPVNIEGFNIKFGHYSLKGADPETLARCSEYMKKEPSITIHVTLGSGHARETLWGCDLNEEYIKINAHYTT
jgi:glutamate N-acetyltransferase/amino-acid N-acetyltransferase